MRIFEVKHGRYEIKRYGCDYCGENKLVKGYKSAPVGQWLHTYLCAECWGVMKNENM